MPPSPTRKEYRLGALLETRAPADPFALFARWYARVLALGGPDRNAVALATADARGRPAARTVLLKHWDARGFVFATHYRSRKGRELAANPYAALLFYWPAFERQVRVEGRVVPVTAADSDALFLARPRGSRLGSMASTQSRVVPDRATLERALARLTQRTAGRDVLRPAHWGGYRVIPSRLEFWQGRPNRLHDRLRYRRAGRRWIRERLAP